MKLKKIIVVVVFISIVSAVFVRMNTAETEVKKEKVVEKKKKIDENGIQTIETSLRNKGYEKIEVEVGKPVKWVIKANVGSVNQCNETLKIPEFNIEKTLVDGENVIEFTPMIEGEISYACWMNMLQSTISVGAAKETSKVEKSDVVAVKEINFEKVVISDFVSDDEYKELQTIELGVSKDGFEYDVAIVKPYQRTTINLIASGLETTVFTVPTNNSTFDLIEGSNQLIFFPTTDFYIYSSDGAFLLYIAVVDDVSNYDSLDVKRRIKAYEESQK